MSKDHHQKFLHDNVTKTYQKAPPKLEASINLETKSISTKLKINDRVKRIARTSAYETLKDHIHRQLSFQSNMSLNKFIKKANLEK